MFQWAQQTLANVAGTQEPIYGPEAIRSVVQQAEQTPYTELQKDDLRWKEYPHTCVETQTFYFVTDDGKIAYAQVIYSNVMGLTVTAQFCAKVFYQDGKTPNLWSTDALHNYHFDEPHYNFYADNCSLELSEDGSSYTIKSSVNPHCKVDIKVTRTVPGFKAGKDGTSYYGTDPENPWGLMFHYFWPSAKVEGTYTTEAGVLDMKGKAMFIHALQGMKPHHAAARWNFVTFKSPTYSASMMEFTTPPSYGSTVVNVGAIATDTELILAGAPMKAEHTESKTDSENDWPEPTATRYTWHGKTADGKDVHAELAGSLGERIDRVDVMGEIPRFVKQIAATTVGTKPYVYQYGPRMKLKVKIGDEEKEEEGTLFTEATFIS